MGFLEVDALLDQVAILAEFADEWIDLSQSERSLWTALQITAHEAILGNTQFQRRRAGVLASHAAIPLDQLENALDAAHSEFALASMDGVADSADVGSGLVGARQQLKQRRRRATRTIRIADTMRATLAAQMLAQQFTAAWIKQAHEQRVPLHVDLPPDPARRRSVVCRFNLDATIQMHRPLAILVVVERFQRQRLQVGLLFGEHRCYLPLGPAVDALVGPALFPVVQIRLRLFQALELLALQRRHLRMVDATLDLFLFDPDRALCTAAPSHCNGSERRDTGDSHPDRRS